MAYPIYKKLNPLWWLGNADDPTPPEWYMPDRSMWWRKICWAFRNPFHNFTFYVIGIRDRKVVILGYNQVFTEGWSWCVNHVVGLWWIYLPFVSFWCKYIRFYFGWRPGGNWGIKFNISFVGRLTK